LTVARQDSERLLNAMRADFSSAGVRLDRLDRSRLEHHIPGLRPAWTAGLLEPSCSDIDVAALHGAYLRAARRRGAELVTDAAVTAIRRRSGTWMLQTRQGPVEAEIIVNAAGAWADEVALAAGVAPIGIQPYRRTIAQLRVAPAVPHDLPLVIDAEGRFYFKPEAGGRLWLSPHDETPCEPCDCAAEDYDVAVAVDRLEQVVDWRVERVEHRWAGLRSFAPDRLPVFGFAADDDRFFWCAGQGGFGIQTAPAAARLCASLLLGTPLGPLLSGVDILSYSPDRFTTARRS
jgi:D-arginine dehydrogenase